MVELFIRYAHFVGIFLLASMLIAENILLSNVLSKKELGKLVVIDGIYGVSAIITLVAGLLLWLAVGKPSEFYSGNPIFHVKLGLFILLALLSIPPTVFLLKNRNTQQNEIVVPSYVLLVAKIEVITLLVLPLLAVFMARGYGYG